MASIQWLVLPFHLVSPNEVLAAGIVLPIACITLTSVRIRIRKIRKLSLGLDDWLVALGVLFITSMGACLIVGQELGVIGYTTPVPSDTIASQAYGLFIAAYVQLAKVSSSSLQVACLMRRRSSLPSNS